MRLVWVFGLMLGLASVALPQDVNTAASLPYNFVDGMVWSSPGGADLAADLYLPKGAGPFPVVLYVHGGGWTSGDRKQLRRQAADLAAKGIAGVAIEYRLSPKYSYPAALYDAKAAVRWIRVNAAKYHFDASRIVAAGSSAGGHLAMLLGLTSGDPKYDGDGCCTGVSSGVSGVVAFNPVLDLTETGHGETMVQKFLGFACQENLAVCKDASPTYHAHATKIPFLILHGTADQMVPYRDAADMTAKLKQAGANATLFTAEGGAHTFWANKLWYTPTLERMEGFLASVFQR